MAGCVVLTGSEYISAISADQIYTEQKHDRNTSGFVLTYADLYRFVNDILKEIGLLCM